MESIPSELIDALQYTFIRRALLAGSMIALCSSFLGVFIVLRKMSLIGDGLAHVSFATVAIGILLGTAPLLVSIPLVMLAAVFIFRLTEKTNLDGDAAIGIISGIGIAGGVLIASMAKGFNIDLFSYLFGSILSISDTELYISISLAVCVIVVIVLFYHDLFALTYDEDFARCAGIKANRVNMILTVLISITVVLGIRVAGTLLISSLILFPAITALQLSNSFKKVIILAMIFSVLSVISGIFLSYIADLPTGASIVMISALFFFASFGLKKVIKI